MSPTTPYDIQADGPTRHGPRKRRKVTRSKLGCLTCRRRKKLCDMEHPTCSACVRLGKVSAIRVPNLSLRGCFAVALTFFFQECEWPDESSSSSRITPVPSHPDPPRPSPGGKQPPSSRPSLHAHHADSTTTVDDFTEIFGGIDALNHIPTPPHSSTFFPMFANNMSLDTTFDRSGIGAGMVHQQGLLGDRVGIGTTSAGGGSGVPGDNGHGANEGHWDASSILDSLFNPNLDEATLQFWTSGFLNQDNNHASSNPGPTAPIFSFSQPPPLASHHSGGLADQDNVSLSIASTTDDALLRYHLSTIVPLLSMGDSASDAFISLVDAHRADVLGQALQTALHALAARHCANKGEMQHEVLSQKKEEMARETVLAKANEWEMGVGEQWSKDDKWTLLAGLLVLVRVKVSDRASRLCVTRTES
jgi:transcriptional activator protein UGA3